MVLYTRTRILYQAMQTSEARANSIKSAGLLEFEVGRRFYCTCFEVVSFEGLELSLFTPQS